MRILIVGSGGREHALGWKIAQSPRASKLYFAPGNGGTRELGENVLIAEKDVRGLYAVARRQKIDLTIVGPEDALAAGIVDYFEKRDVPIFGPSRMAARIESWKPFAKRLMERVGISTAPFRVFRSLNQARHYIRKHGLPIVIKAAGLAGGKGVYVCKTWAEAEYALDALMVKFTYWGASREVVIEDCIDGEELSAHALCDRNGTVCLFPFSQDHKSIFDNDEGPNTGGMGTHAPYIPSALNADGSTHAVKSGIIQPALAYLAQLGHPFVGCLYPGLMATQNGSLITLEFNARPGDPETQCYMRLLKTDLVDMCLACINGTLDKLLVEWHPGYAVCVIVASVGYPGKPKVGIPIYGLAEAAQVPGVVLLHAGTRFDRGTLVTSGGRVIGVSAYASTRREAVANAYEAIFLLCFEQGAIQYRTDIGAKALRN